MLIRRPPAEVFRAFVDPAVTTRFWFTKSTGPLAPAAKVRWDWEMYGAAAKVTVQAFEENRRLAFHWGRPDRQTTVELRFIEHEKHTHLEITEQGFSGTGDEMVAQALDSISGFSLVLATVKALLEHQVVLTTVLDHVPKGLKR